MELRDIEIFLTLAEELHFGRTAERLHLTQARISQSIKKQERRIGGLLFERTTRTVRLTALGEQLRDDLRPLFSGMRESVSRAILVAQGKTDLLRIGSIPTNTNDLRPFWDEFRTRHPEWGLQIRHNGFTQPFAALRNGEIDALVCWLPVDEPDLTVGPVLFSEPKVLLVAAEHELAGRGSVSEEVRGNFPGATARLETPDYWEDAHSSFYTPSGRQVDKVVDVATVVDILMAVAHDRIIQTMGAHFTKYFSRPDIVSLGFDSEPRLTWALVWRADAESECIRALAAVIRELGPASF